MNEATDETATGGDHRVDGRSAHGHDHPATTDGQNPGRRRGSHVVEDSTRSSEPAARPRARRVGTKAGRDAAPDTDRRGSAASPVLAVDTYNTNAELIAAAARLGHLRVEWRTLDCTYQHGVFWKAFEPDTLVKSDLVPLYPDVIGADFRALPFDPFEFDVTVIDPPYGLRGAVNKTNGGYGLDAGYMSVGARHELIRAGLTEAIRVTKLGGRVLLKCQDQVCSGRMWWQTQLFTEHARRRGARLIERLDMLGGDRDQPERMRWVCLACGKGSRPVDPSAGPKHRCSKVVAWMVTHDGFWLEQRPSRQHHAEGRPSSLLVFRKEVHK